MAHTDKSRKDGLPIRRPCTPYKDPRCWKRKSLLLVETCEYCCSPFIHKTGRGDPWCFDAEWTYERCCQTDFMDLVCEEKRKGEEGGCVDCKKTVSYICLTPPEKRLQDSQDTYNKKVDKFNGLQTEAERLKKLIADTKADLIEKDGIYQEKYMEHSRRLQIWSSAFNNATRLLSEGRLEQQRKTWNNSAALSATAREALQSARETLRNATGTLEATREAEARGREAVERNETARAAAIEHVAQTLRVLERTQSSQAAAEAAVAAADAELANATVIEMSAQEDVVAKNRTTKQVYTDSAEELDAALASKCASGALERNASRAHAEADAAVQAQRNAGLHVLAACESAALDYRAAEQSEEAAARAVGAAAHVLSDAARVLGQHESDLESVERREAAFHDALVSKVDGAAAMRCLISRTHADMRAAPKAAPGGAGAHEGSCGNASQAEDSNEFCPSWAREGECERNPQYMRQTCPRSCSGELPAAPSCSKSGALLGAGTLENSVAGLVLDLLAYASSVNADPDDTPGLDALNVSEELEQKLDAATSTLALAQELAQSAQDNVSRMEVALSSATLQHQRAQEHSELKRRAREDASLHVLAMEEAFKVFEGFLEGNETVAVRANESLEVQRMDQRRLQAAAREAAALEQGLGRALQISEDGAAQKREAVVRARRRVHVLQEHIEVLNASIAENLTSAVMEWLLVREEDSAEEGGGPGRGWGSMLLSAAKSALVSVVGSLEAFLDTYVVSMTDRNTVIELVRAVDDRKAATSQLDDAKTAVMEADAQTNDAKGSLAKAQTSRKHADEFVDQAADLVLQAEEVSRAAEARLQVCRQGHTAARLRLEEARSVAADCEAKLQASVAATAAAAAETDDYRIKLASSREVLEIASAEVVEATAALSVARGASTAAEEGATLFFREQLRQHCDASEEEFEIYMEQRELLSLLRAVVLHREQELDAVGVRYAEAAANHTALVVAQLTAHDAAVDAQHAHRDCAHRASAADAELHHQEALRSRSAAQLALAQERARADQDRAARVLDRRAQASAAATSAAVVYEAAKQERGGARGRCSARATQLMAAVNMTQAHIRDVEAARGNELAALQSLNAARVWLTQLLASMDLEAKARAVEEAAEAERKRQAAEAKASRRERAMRAAVGTHERHLKLVNAQGELAQKDAARVHAKAEYQTAEKAVLDAQAKLEAHIKDEEKTNANIGETYAELQKDLEEYRLAKKGYADQDPEDRKRSFHTFLEGSGPDPDGVNLR